MTTKPFINNYSSRQTLTIHDLNDKHWEIGKQWDENYANMKAERIEWEEYKAKSDELLFKMKAISAVIDLMFLED